MNATWLWEQVIQSCFAEEEWCTPIIVTQSKVFGMLQFSKAMYSSSWSWFLDSLLARWPKLQPMLNRNSVNLTSFESLLSFGKKKSTAVHTDRLLSAWGAKHMMITVCTLKLKAISLILVLIPAACVTQPGFILSASKNHNAQQIQALPLESVELILYCLAAHTVVYT